MTLIESLKNLGLNEKEAKVYLALLQLGKSTAYTVAIRSGLKKPTTYVILQQLVEKGFVVNVPRAKKQQFVAESPEKCVALAEEKIKLTHESLPELLALKKKQEHRVNVAYFEGLAGIKESYKRLVRVMKEKSPKKRNFVGFYAKIDALDSELERSFDQITTTFAKHQIRRRGITTYNPLIAQKYLRSLDRFGISGMKALSEKKYSSYISIEVYDRFIHIISQRNLQSLIIEDQDIADVIVQIFEMVWELVEHDKENYLKFSSVGDMVYN